MTVCGPGDLPSSADGLGAVHLSLRLGRVTARQNAITALAQEPPVATLGAVDRPQVADTELPGCGTARVPAGISPTAVTLSICAESFCLLGRSTTTSRARPVASPRTGPAGEADRSEQYLKGMSSGMTAVAYDRVSERRRAVALARHLREAEGLSNAQIGARLGRSPATVKAYLSDPRAMRSSDRNSLQRAISLALLSI